MIKKVIYLVRVALSRAPDTSTPQGRSLDRYRRAAISSLLSMVARVVNIGTNLLIVPMMLHYLGEARYGLWGVLTGLIMFLTVTDLGLGVGLQNALSTCHGKDDRKSPRGYVSSALFVMTLMFGLFAAGAFWVLPHVGLDRLIKVDDPRAAAELLPTAQALLIAFGFGLPAGMIQRIYAGYQRAYWVHLQFALGNILALAALYVAMRLNQGLPVLAFLFMGMRFVVLLGGSLVLFRSEPWLSPSLRHISLQKIRQVLHVGITAMGAQVALLLMTAGPALVIGSRLGTTFVTPVDVTRKLLGAMAIILTAVLTPLWPAYAEAAARGDMDWVRKTFVRSIKFGAGVLIPNFILIVLFGQWIIGKWTGRPAAVPDYSLLLACSVWSLLLGWTAICCMLLNGLNHMIGQAVYGISFAMIGLLVAYTVAGSNQSAALVIWTVILVGELPRSIALGAESWWVLRKRARQAAVPISAAVS